MDLPLVSPDPDGGPSIETAKKGKKLAFYGDIDFIPTEEYTEKDAQVPIEDANFVVGIAKQVNCY